MTLTTYPKIEQGTPEWMDLRRGIVTASVVGKLIAINAPDATAVECPTCKTPTPIKTFHDARTAKVSTLPPVYEPADNEASRGLTLTLTAERIAGFTEDGLMTSDMWRGVECEPFARDAYSEHYAAAAEIGFMVEDKWGFSIGFSPDGLVGDDGLIEIKAPRAKTHVGAVLANEVPAYNMAQLQCGLLVSGRKWIDFIPFVGGLALWTKRVYPDPRWHEAIVAAVARFETTSAEMVAAYDQATTGLPATERVDNNLGLVF